MNKILLWIKRHLRKIVSIFILIVVAAMMVSGISQYNEEKARLLFYREAEVIRLSFLEAKQSVYDLIKQTNFDLQELQTLVFERSYKDSIKAMQTAIEDLSSLCEEANAIAFDIEIMETQLQDIKEIADYVNLPDYSSKVLQSFLEGYIKNDQANINTVTDWLSDPNFPQGYNYEDKLTMFQ